MESFVRYCPRPIMRVIAAGRSPRALRPSKPSSIPALHSASPRFPRSPSSPHSASPSASPCSGCLPILIERAGGCRVFICVGEDAGYLFVWVRMQGPLRSESEIHTRTHTVYIIVCACMNVCVRARGVCARGVCARGFLRVRACVRACACVSE